MNLAVDFPAFKEYVNWDPGACTSARTLSCRSPPANPADLRFINRVADESNNQQELVGSSSDGGSYDAIVAVIVVALILAVCAVSLFFVKTRTSLLDREEAGAE